MIAVEEAEAVAEEPIVSNKEQDQEAEVVDGDESEGKKGKKAKGPGKKLVQGTSTYPSDIMYASGRLTGSV